MADDDQKPETPSNNDEILSDAELAAEWEKTLESADQVENVDHHLDAFIESPPIQNSKELDQNEIDSLLGFDVQLGLEKEQPVGIHALLNNAMIFYERLPMLEVVFDRMLRTLTTSLRNFTSDNVDISMESMTSIRFGDYLNSIPLPAMLGVFKAEEWDNQGLIMVDSPLIYSIVDVLLGGRRSVTAMRVEGRPYTTIERNLIEKLMRVYLNDLGIAFEPVSPVSFKFERLEINPRFATIVRPANAGILVKMRIEIDDRGGKIDLMIPYATIEPIRELMLQNFMGEKFGRDSIWENHLAAKLWETEITFEVHLHPEQFRLSHVLEWSKGDQIDFLESSPHSLVTAKCGDEELFNGRIGQKNGRVALKVDSILFRHETTDEEGEQL
jgi:flagellar motor switch protein FliM